MRKNAIENVKKSYLVFFYILLFGYSLIFPYLCAIIIENNAKKTYHRHPKDCHPTYPRRSNTLLDVQGLRFPAHSPRADWRDELVVDASLLPFRHSCAGFQRIAMAAKSGACGWKATYKHSYLLHIYLIRRLTGNTENRWIYQMRYTETMGRNFISKGSWHSSHRESRWFSHHSHHHSFDIAEPDAGISDILLAHRNAIRRDIRSFLHHWLHRNSYMWRSGTDVTVCFSQETCPLL